MNTPATRSNTSLQQQDIDDISSMLLPLNGINILLPGVAVAEIIRFEIPEKGDDEEMPAWYLGAFYWRNQKVPLVSYEVITGADAVPISDSCRIAVLNNTGSGDLDFYAILLQGTPRLLRLAPEDVSANDDKEIREGLKMYVDVAGEEAVVPDICYIEQKLAEHIKDL